MLSTDAWILVGDGMTHGLNVNGDVNRKATVWRISSLFTVRSNLVVA